MHLVELPDELILSIADALDNFRDVATLSLGNRHLFNVLNPFMYYQDARQFSSLAVLWAARNDRPDVARKAVDAAMQVASKTNMRPAVKQVEANDLTLFDDLDLDPIVSQHESASHVGHLPLQAASREGYADVVKVLLELDGIDPDWRDRSGASSLFFAAARKHAGVVDCLLQTGKVDINRANDDGVTALWLAAGAREGSPLIVHALLSHGCTVANTPDKTQRISPFQRAVRKGNPAVVKLFLESGLVDGNSYFPDSTLPLMEAIDHSRTEAFKMLVEVGGADINACLAYGFTPLCKACQHGGSNDIVTYLLSCDRLNIGAGSEDRPQLFLWAAKNGREDCINMLLAADTVEDGVKDLALDRAVSLAAQEGHVGVMRLFLEHGFNVNGGDDMYGSASLPISLAAERGHNHVIELLLQSGQVDDTWKECQYTSPLFKAVQCHHTETVSLLCHHGADVAGCSRNVLSDMYSACTGQSDVLEVLLRNGAALDVTSSLHGWTPLHIAAADGNESLVSSLLQDPGVNVDAVDNYGRTAAEMSRYTFNLFGSHGSGSA